MPITFQTTLPVSDLDRQHAEYAAYVDSWRDIELLNAGGVSLKAEAHRFLAKRPKEHGDVFAERQRRFTYQNILGTGIGWYQAKLFRQNPEIDITGDEKTWQDWLANCDNAGGTFPDFYRNVWETAALYKRAWVVTDMPRRTQEVESRADEKALGLDRPYVVSYAPSSVTNWEFDDYGNLEWVVIRCEENEAGSPFAEPKLSIYWYYYDRTQWAAYVWTGKSDEARGGKPNDPKAMAQLEDSGEHFLAAENRVPVACLELPDALWLANRIYLQLVDHINQENSYTWALFMANLAILKIRGPWDQQSATISEVTALHLPDPSSDASYLEPEGASFQHSADRLHYLREEIYRGLYLQAQGRSSAATPAAQSGYSKEQDMAPANDVLNGFGDWLRAAMKSQLQTVAVALKKTPESVMDVRGFRFDTNSVDQEISVAKGMTDIGINSPTLEREIAKTVAAAYLEDADQKTRDKVNAEIDANPTATEQAEKEKEDQMKAFEQGFSNKIPAFSKAA